MAYYIWRETMFLSRIQSGLLTAFQRLFDFHSCSSTSGVRSLPVLIWTWLILKVLPTIDQHPVCRPDAGTWSWGDPWTHCKTTTTMPSVQPYWTGRRGRKGPRYPKIQSWFVIHIILPDSRVCFEYSFKIIHLLWGTSLDWLLIIWYIYIYNIHVHHPILGANHQVRKGPGDFVSQKRSLGKDHFKNGPRPLGSHLL